MKTDHGRNCIRRFTLAIACAITVLSACEKTKPPTPKSVSAPGQPVKNVEGLPAGTIQEGARTMNRSSDLGRNLEQQKQDRDREAESQSK